MKKIYSILLTAVSLLSFAPKTNAQTIAEDIGALEFPELVGKENVYNVDKNVAYRKSISKPVTGGTYWIKLETFATGSASTVATPADIVLVLDLSSSMRNNYVTYQFLDNYRPRNTGWLYSDNYSPNNYIYWYEYNGVDCRVDHIRIYDNTGTTIGQGNAHYALTFRDPQGNRHYMLNGNIYDSWDAVPKTDANNQQNDILWTDRLKRGQGVSGKRRIDALRSAVKSFIDVININDKYEDKAGTRLRPNGRIGNRISMVTFWSQGNLVNTLAQGEMADATETTQSTAEYLKGLVDAFPETNSGTRPDLGIAIANQQLASIPNTRDSYKTVVVFTDGEPYPNDVSTNHPYGHNYDSAIAATLTSKSTHGANVFTVGLFSDTPWEGDNMWAFMNYMSSNAPNASSMTSPGAGFNKEAGYYKDASNGTDLTTIFEEIAHQSGGSSNKKLSGASSNVDIISASFKLPQDATVDNIRIFTAKCLTANHTTKTYTFAPEILAKNSEDEFDVYDNNGYWVESKDVDDDITIDPNGLANKTISVTGFDYSNNWCGPKDNIIQGHKIIIMIPIQMDENAVGGPNVATNVEGSGLYVPGQTEPEITFEIPHVSLPVNLFIEKEGLEGIESAKFMIERAIIPDVEEGEEWSIADIDPNSWQYVSTVFVTNSENAKTNPETNNPWVKVRGLPATTQIDENNDGIPDVDASGKVIQKGLVYRISEEKWSWSYNPAQTDPEDETTVGPQYTVPGKVNNPFLFNNAKRTSERIDVTIRHAESKVTNHFSKTVTKTEVYDDSKTNTRP